MADRCRRHTWHTRAEPLRMVNGKGWPTGWYQVQETKLCATCTAFETRYVPGARAREPEQAMELYREQQREKA